MAVVENPIVNAGANLQQLAGAKVHHGGKQEGPRYREPSCFLRFIPGARRPDMASAMVGHAEAGLLEPAYETVWAGLQCRAILERVFWQNWGDHSHRVINISATYAFVRVSNSSSN